MPVKTYLLPLTLVLLAGCAGTQVKDSAQTTTAAILVTTLALAADGEADDKRREYRPGEWTYCDIGCKFQQQLGRERLRDEIKRQQRRHESGRLQANFDAFIEEHDYAGQSSAQPSLSVVRRDRLIHQEKF